MLAELPRPRQLCEACVFLHAESSLPFCICAAQQPVCCQIHACTGSWLQRMLSSTPAPPLFCTEHPPPEPGNPLTRQDGERSKVIIRRLAPQILRHGPPSITDKKCRPSLYKFLKHTHTHTSGRCPPCTHRMIKSLRGALLKEKVFSPDPSFVFLFL